MERRPGWSLLLSAALLAASSIGCGSSTSPTLPPPTLTVTPSGAAIVGVTAVTFQATSPAADTTYSWSFGDGTSASGTTVTHVYTREGSLSAVLTAAKGSATGSTSAAVTVRSVTGTWRPDFFFAPCFTVRLTQNGGAVDAVAINGTAASAALQSPRAITLTIGATPAQNCGDAIQSRSGTFDDALDTFTLTITGTQTDTWRRQ